MALLLEGRLLKTQVLPARDQFPESVLITILDSRNGESLNLIADAEVHDALSSVPELTEVVVELTWRRLDLNALGGQGRGKAYRLRVARLVEVKS